MPIANIETLSISISIGIIDKNIIIIIKLCILLRLEGIRINIASWKGWIYREPRVLSEGQKSSDNIYIYSREREGGREGLTSKCDIVSSHTG